MIIAIIINQVVEQCPTNQIRVLVRLHSCLWHFPCFLPTSDQLLFPEHSGWPWFGKDDDLEPDGSGG